MQATFELPPCTQLFTLERICWVLRLMLGKLKVWKWRGGWVGCECGCGLVGVVGVLRR